LTQTEQPGVVGSTTTKLTMVWATRALLASLPAMGVAFLSPQRRSNVQLDHPSSNIKGAPDAHIRTFPSLFSKRTTSEELIPREILFGNPENTSPILSPDGKNLAYLAPSPNGVMNIFIRNLLANGEGDKSKDRMITNEPKRAIRSVAWAYDSETILFMNDFDGDENFHLFAVDALGDDDDGTIPTPRDLTPGKDVKAQNIITNYRYPNEILVGTNQRDPKTFDMYRLFYKTGEMHLDTLNPGDVIGWKVEDESFEVRGATVRNEADSSTTIRIRQSGDAVNNDESETEWKDVFHFPYGEEGGLIDFCADGGKTGYLTSSLGRETTALLKVDLISGETIEEIYANDKCNVGGITLHKDTKELRALSHNYARTERVFYDRELEKDYDFLKANGPNPDAEVGVVSRTQDESKWIVNYFQSDGPTAYFVYDKPNQAITPLFVSNPKLLQYKFAPMEDVRIRSRDGLELVGYLTRACTEGPSPLILLVHGGPWARDYWGFDSRAQWFANRGYATLKINYRGSTGYGKSFLHKGDGQWGVGDMQHDLTDSVKWAINEGIADAENICIYGGSYGGYACLAGELLATDTLLLSNFLFHLVSSRRSCL
jgi:dipeptidyl aminopeptidase/acylaminoacyl peptidase